MEKITVVDELLSQYSANDASRKKIKIYATEQTEIQGELLIEDKNYDERVSDCLNDSRSFIPVLDTGIYSSSKLVAEHDFICINK